MLIFDEGQAMITDIRELARLARIAGMEVPDCPDNFHAAEYPHFSLYVQLQLCRTIPMRENECLLQNAKLIASIPDDRVFNVTLSDVEMMGFK